jgi:hypothetical protein
MFPPLYRSLDYLTYPTRIVFKSSKVVPVMLVSVIIVGRRCVVLLVSS